MVPHVTTAAAAERIVSATRYAPAGARGLSPYTRCHGYTHEGLADSMARHREETLVGILVEGQEGVANLAEISSVPGIDLVYLGLYDISQSVGLPGQLEHPKVLQQLESSLEVISRAGKFAGTFSREVAACRRFREMGFHFIAYVADSYALVSFYQGAVREYSQADAENRA